MKRLAHAVGALFLGLSGAGAALAGEVDVLNAKVDCDAKSNCRIVATLRHADVGTSHYADAFIVLAPDETVLGTRVLLHPHVHEQPFTRALDALPIPADLETVIIQGRDNVHGTGGRTFTAPVVRRPARPADATATTPSAPPEADADE